MATSMYSVKGKAKWAKVFEFNRDMGEYHKDYDGAYTIDVYLDEDQMKTVSKSGTQVKPKIDDEGIFVKFKRKHADFIPALGGAPKVVDKDDQPWDTEVLIGNGSEVEVFFTVYSTKKGNGTRLEGIRVLDLVEVESEGSGIAALPF